MKLTRVEARLAADLREERSWDIDLGIVPFFYSRLVEEADTFLIEEEGPPGRGASVLGYVLAVERAHDDHSHLTTVELYLDHPHRHRYDDVLDLVAEDLRPVAHLTRTDDCLYNATLLSRGLQVEPTALVMLWPQVGAPSSLGEEIHCPAVEPFTSSHVDDVRALLDDERDADVIAELGSLAASQKAWVVFVDGAAVGLIARQDGGDGIHELLDFVLARAAEPVLAEALRQVAESIDDEGLRPSGVIDATEGARRRIFRQAGFHVAASYMVYYDAVRGRPSVGDISTEELQALLEADVPVHVVDVLGEEHWEQGHIPGAVWLDFKGLAREARRRFKTDETIVVYCTGPDCEAGGIAADKLRQLGFADVRHYAGGIEAWREAGLEVAEP